MRTNSQQNDPSSAPTGGPGAGERALMRAVLEEAIHCLAARTGPRGERARLAAEARAWVAADDLQWPFSFTNLCDHLGFDVETLRARLLASRPFRPSRDVDGVNVEVADRAARPGHPEQDINDMIRAGAPLRVVAARFGISMSKASTLSTGLASRMKADRNAAIYRLRREGWTHRALATHFGLSRVRVSRICAAHDRTDRDRPAA